MTPKEVLYAAGYVWTLFAIYYSSPNEVNANALKQSTTSIPQIWKAEWQKAFKTLFSLNAKLSMLYISET